MNKEPINIGDLDPQQRLDVARGEKLGADGLEVVGYVAVPIPSSEFSDWYAVWTREKAAGIGSTPLCRLTDAQRLLSQRDAEYTSMKRAAELLHESTQLLITERDQLREELAQRDAEVERLESRYQREVYGLNNEGDPIGGGPAGGYANDLRRARDEVRELRTALESQQAASVGGDREAFEAEFRSRGFLVNRIESGDIFCYDTTGLQSAWTGWKARAALSPAGGGVVMPERKQRPAGWAFSPMVDDGWNACLDEFARLNAKPSDAPELLANSQEGES